ncbi:MAG: hypothetical protein ACU0BN_19530 [Sulfitobacter sp.]
MRDPAEIYNMQDTDLNDSRADALLSAVESCRKLEEWNELSQRAYWLLAAFWNGNQVSYANWAGLINDAIDEAMERLA